MSGLKEAVTMEDEIVIENVKGMNGDASNAVHEDVKTFTYVDADKGTEKVWNVTDINQETAILTRHMQGLQERLLQLQLQSADVTASIEAVKTRILHSLPSDDKAISIKE